MVNRAWLTWRGFRFLLLGSAEPVPRTRGDDAGQKPRRQGAALPVLVSFPSPYVQVQTSIISSPLTGSVAQINHRIVALWCFFVNPLPLPKRSNRPGQGGAITGSRDKLVAQRIGAIRLGALRA
jgi:hypothetical protein